MFGGDMMRDLMVGSGWLGLLACMVLGGIARLPLAAAGTRRAEGRPWAVQGVLGFGLLGLALLAAPLAAMHRELGETFAPLREDRALETELRQTLTLIRARHWRLYA